MAQLEMVVGWMEGDQKWSAVDRENHIRSRQKTILTLL
jgi:hypothetical protein